MGLHPSVDGYARACERILWQRGGAPVRDWLANRGLGEEVLRANHVGADPGRRLLPRTRGLPHGRSIAAVFPAHDPAGNLRYLQTRYLDPGDGPKYDNPASALGTNPRLAWTTPVHPTGQEVLIICEGIPDALTAAQAEPGVVQVSVNHGFEGSDHPDLAASVVVTTDDDPAGAEALARRIGDDFLATVRSQSWIGPGVAESIDRALAAAGRPVVLADRADNAGGGAAGDSTFVLAELLRRGVGDVAVALIWDPIAVGFCHAAGVGARLPLRIGGKCGPLSGDPIDLDVEVRSVRTDATQALFGAGEPRFRLGRTAAVHARGVDIVMSSVRTQVFSHHVFSQHEIDHLDRKVLVVKSTQHFMNDFGRFAAAVVRCDGPGTLTADLSTLPYTRIRRPMLGPDPADLLEVEPMPPVVSRRRIPTSEA